MTGLHPLHQKEAEAARSKVDAAGPAAADTVVVRRPGARTLATLPGEVLQYRELLLFLTWRNLKVRYRQTLLGAGWAVLQPLMTMVVFSLFFGKLAKIPSDGVPYPIFSFSGLVPWTLFSAGLSGAAASLVGSASLINKVYFPRIIVPLASILVSLVDFFIAFVVLLGMAMFMNVTPSWGVVFVPAFALLAMVAAAGIGIVLSALNIRFRDIKHATPFLIQLWLFATPIAYPSSLVPDAWRPLYALNPMVTVVDGFRWALLGTPAPPLSGVAISSTAALLFFVGAIWYFRRLEARFADII